MSPTILSCFLNIKASRFFVGVGDVKMMMK
jgi:hypothetical protein